MNTKLFWQISKTLALAVCFGLIFALASPAYGQAYKIQSGDNLWKLSKNFGVSIEGLRLNNNISGDTILAGDTLELPATHTVQRGDSLSMLAQQYGTSIDTIQQANKIAGSMILVGQKLTIPGTSPSALEQEQLAVSDKDMELLARAVYSEARGEAFAGQVAVAAVILNRVEHPDFPDTISGVVYQPGAFTAVQDGQFWLTPDQTAYAAVHQALEGVDPSQGATFYYNPVTATNQWIRGRPVISQIGRHIFAR